MNQREPAARWLFIVRAGERDLYEQLTQRLSGLARVIHDRRGGPRRQARVAVPAERRRTDRRRAVAAGARPGTGTGYHLVYHAAELDVYEADASVPAVCAECGTVLTFDMPRFAEAPAHIHLTVIHTPQGERVQHSVDLEAVAVTGRAILACRLAARRHAWNVDDIARGDSAPSREH